MKSFLIKITGPIGILLLLVGCASYKYTASIPKVSSPAHFAPLKFYVKEADGLMDQLTKTATLSFVRKHNLSAHSLVQHDNARNDFVLQEIKGQARTSSVPNSFTEQFELERIQLLNEILVQRYPSLFSLGNDTIPLKIKILQDSNLSSKSYMMWFFGSAMIVGTILPLPEEVKWDISLDAVVLLPGKGEIRTPEKKGTVTLNMWISLITPIGLMPFPGEGDVRWSQIEPYQLADSAQNLFVRPEERFLFGYTPSGAKQRSLAFYTSLSDLVAGSVSALSQKQLEELKNQYYKNMRVY